MSSTVVSKKPVFCPRSNCPSRPPVGTEGPLSEPRVRKRSSFFRKEGAKWVRRYSCLYCQRSFSEATSEVECWQKKRALNEAIWKLYCSQVSQRRMAFLLGLARATISRKLQSLSHQMKADHERWLNERAVHGEHFDEVQFDEMETFEHTKCKPLSISLVVCQKTRMILGVGVASMPANGPLAAISRKKYGPRKDDRARVAHELLQKLKPVVAAHANWRTDQNPKYPSWLKTHFPDATHETFKGRRGCIVGQGELKKVGFDPLFSLNHTAAMIRANVNRLARRTWCTTKKAEKLLHHLDLYIQFHNRALLSAKPFL